jgi:hypothetical protein
MLILLKQSPTGLFASDQYGQNVEIYEQKWFNTTTLDVQTNSITEANSLPFQMSTGQLIHTASGTEYRYNGSGGFTTNAVPSSPTFTLGIAIAPTGGGTTGTPSPSGPYTEGQSVTLSATAATDFTFVSWTRNGVVVSSTAAFTYVMPASNVQLIANFIADADIPTPPPAPDPVALPTSFYDLELRINGAQIPMPPFVQKKVEGLLSDVFEGEYSYPGIISLSPKEMAAIGLPNDPQTASGFTETIPAEIWAFGNLRYRGYLDILKADEDRIRFSFILDSGFFISKIKPSPCRNATRIRTPFPSPTNRPTP